MLGKPGPGGGIYSSHGLITTADLDEYRRDTDWYELHQQIPEEGQCVHARFWADDCDKCRRPLMVDEIREALTDESSPIYLSEQDCRDTLRQILGAGTVTAPIFDALARAVEDTLRPRQQRAADALRAAEDERLGDLL